MPSWKHSFCGVLLLLLPGELRAKEFSLLTDRTYASGFDAFIRCLLNEDQLKCLHHKWHNMPCNANTNDHEAKELYGPRIAVERHRLLLISVAFATDSIVSMKGRFIWFTSKSETRTKQIFVFRTTKNDFCHRMKILLIYKKKVSLYFVDVEQCIFLTRLDSNKWRWSGRRRNTHKKPEKGRMKSSKRRWRIVERRTRRQSRWMGYEKGENRKGEGGVRRRRKRWRWWGKCVKVKNRHTCWRWMTRNLCVFCVRYEIKIPCNYSSTNNEFKSCPDLKYCITA